MGCNTSSEQVLAASGTENLDNETNQSLQKNKLNSKNLDNNENQKISKNDNDLQIEDYGVDEEEAAVKIQAAFRGHKTRTEIKEKKMNAISNANNNINDNFQDLDPEELEKAATKIQASYRGHRTRSELKDKKQPNNNVEPKETADEAEELDQQAAVKIQAVFRGHKTRATMKNNSESSNTQSKASGNAATSPTEPEPTKEELEQEFDPNDKELCNAASKIQATFRGHLARKIQTTENGKLKEEDVDIQELTKKVAEELDIDLNDPELNAAATKIQASFRGHKVRKTETDDAK